MKKYSQNNFLSYLLILVSFSILIFFTSNIYQKIQIQQDTLNTQTLQINDDRANLTRLRDLQQELLLEDSDAIKSITWFSWEYNDENIVNHIYSYAQKINLWDERIIIRGIELQAWQQSDVWFERADINLDIVTSSQEALFGFLNYLTDEESSYRFYINDFDYQLWETSWNIIVDIPLILYYKNNE